MYFCSKHTLSNHCKCYIHLLLMYGKYVFNFCFIIYINYIPIIMKGNVVKYYLCGDKYLHHGNSEFMILFNDYKHYCTIVPSSI